MNELKEKVHALHREGKSHREIAQLLEMPRQEVNKLLKQPSATHFNVDEYKNWIA
ncbi:MAG TPA: hypothetical protein VD794_05740 [Flavisolibacter sp.]|nr:hypothetical protein [Flavisolibacter sp.]